MDFNYMFESIMAANMGLGLSVALILQLCKFMYKDWLTKDDIKSNNALTLCALGYSLLIFLVLFFVK